MNKKSLLLAIGLSVGIGAKAQLIDVTSQYITNPGFEECKAVEITECKGYGSVVHGNGHCLMLESSVAHGYDYAEQGWQLEAQNTNANGGVVIYGNKVQYSKSGFEDVPAAGPTDNSGTKALCFCGNNNLVYKQPNSVTLPAGAYKLTVYVYPYNGAYSTAQPTTRVKDFTGFVDVNGNEYFSQNRTSNKEITLNSNSWNQDVIEFELTEATTGNFQVSYGIQYFLVIDDLKLEYQGGVITTALENVLTKANALNALLQDEGLTSAIATAQAFIENPTTQDDVAAQAEALYTAMSTALAATANVPMDITSVYVENPSFETGKVDPWTWGSSTGSVCEPVNEDSKPYIDGKNIVEFAQAGSNAVYQTIGHLPAGFYALDAKLNKKATMVLGSNETVCQGGTEALYLNVHPAVLNFAGGDLKIGIKGNTAYNVDKFRLVYGKDEASLLAFLLTEVKAVAQEILNKSEYANVTGEERTTLQNAIEGTDIEAINTAVNSFASAKDAYDRFVKIKIVAATYTSENYPYAKAETLEQIQTALAAEVATRAQAIELTTVLTDACINVVWENAYCEGVENTDYTERIIAANANGSAVNSAWTVNNVTIRTLTNGKAWLDRAGTRDKAVYGTAESYSSSNTDLVASMQQTVSDLPAGTYVLSVNMMAKKDLPVDIRVNNKKVATFVGKGTVTNDNWYMVVCSFEKEDENALTLRIEESAGLTYKEWYVEDFHLYRIGGGVDGIQTANAGILSSDNSVYDLQGRRVAQPVRGLYIMNGKKVVVK